MMEDNINNGSAPEDFDEEVCERYLFGELTEEEQEQFETAYFNDDSFFERFAAVKNELLDLYARGELDDARRSRMEPHFNATAPRRKRISDSSEFIQALTSIASQRQIEKLANPHSSSIGWFEKAMRTFTLPRLAAAAVLILLAVALGLFHSGGRPEEEVADQKPEQPASNLSSDPSQETRASETQTSVRDEISEGLPNNDNRPANSLRASNDSPDAPQSPQSPESPFPAKENLPSVNSNNNVAVAPPQELVASDNSRKTATTNENSAPPITLSPVERDESPAAVTLRAGTTRSTGSGNALSIRNDRDQPVAITLVFKSEKYASYVVTLSTVGGSRIATQRFSHSAVSYSGGGSTSLVLRLPSSRRLTRNDYVIKLDGVEAGGSTETINEYYLHIRRSGGVDRP